MALLAKRLGLKMVTTEALTIRRRRAGKGFCYVYSDGALVRDKNEIARLASLAVPPAYQDVVYAHDPAAHLQAVGRDAAGRLQYRYHPEWEKVREQRKAHRLARLVGALPKIRRNVSAHLSGDQPTPEFALAAVLGVIRRPPSRPPHEAYAP